MLTTPLRCLAGLLEPLNAPRSLPPVHPSDCPKHHPRTALVGFLKYMDAKLQKFFCDPRPSRKTRTEMPLACPHRSKQPRGPCCNGGWQPIHTRHLSYDEEAPAPISGSASLHRAVTAPEATLQRFLDRDFMATVQQHHRWGAGTMSRLHSWLS